MILPILLTATCLFLGILIMLAGFPLIVIGWLIDRSGKINHYLEKWYLSTLARIIGMKITIEGQENYRRSDQYLIIANHKSSADIFAAGRALRLHFKFFAASFLFSIPVFGWCMAMAGYLPIDRANRKQARESIVKGTGILKQGKASLLIFPEGTRVKAPEIGEFKLGFLRIASEARKPILPVVMEGTEEIKKKNDFWFRPGHVQIAILPPVSTEGLTEDNWNETKKMYEVMIRAEYNRLRANKKIS